METHCSEMMAFPAVTAHLEENYTIPENCEVLDAIKFCFGLFCSGNFTFGETERQKLANAGNFSWEDAVKINFKDQLMVTLKSGEEKTISMEEMAARLLIKKGVYDEGSLNKIEIAVRAYDP